MLRLSIFIFFCFLANPAFAGYSYVRAITVYASKVSGASDLTQFPVLVCANGVSPCNMSFSGLNQSGTGAHVQNSSGYDIIFTTDAACANKLTWEMENYNSSTGEFEAWVTNTSTALSHSSNTVFYMCYGNAAISTLQSTASSVWDSNYQGVWHLAEASNGQAVDSTINANNSTSAVSTATTGLIDGAQAFTVAGSSKITIPAIAAQTGASKATISGWAYITGSNSISFGADTSGNGGGNRLILEISSTQTYLAAENGGASYSHFNATDTGWHYYVGVFDGTQVGNARYTQYLDGVSQTLGILGTPPATLGTAQTFYIGYTLTGGYSIGTLDEVRLSVGAARTAGWIATEYNNQSSPVSFYMMGPEQSTGPHQNLINGVSKVSGVSLLN